MNTLAITLVRLAFRGDPSAADIVTDYLDGTRALGDPLRGVALCCGPRAVLRLADRPRGATLQKREVALAVLRHDRGKGVVSRRGRYEVRCLGEVISTHRTLRPAQRAAARYQAAAEVQS